MELIPSLEQFISTSISLRKVRSLIIQQPRKPFSPRPQSHTMIISPFGTFKSSILMELREIQGKDMDIIERFTSASVTGSISKNGDYVPSILFNFAGKTIAIDEWNNIDEDAQASLLSLLENQEVSRGLGFSVRSKWSKRGKYGSVVVKENMIKAMIHFSCIACAMTYPMPTGKVQVQKSKALLSRYLPAFVDIDDKELFKIISGHYGWEFFDNSNKVDKIVILEDVYQEYVEAYWDYINENDLIPAAVEDKGFMTRVNMDVLRIGLANSLPKNEIKYVVDNAKKLKKYIPYSEIILRNYMYPGTKGKKHEFNRFYQLFPAKSIEWYASHVGVSTTMIRKYARELGVKLESGRELIYNKLKMDIQKYKEEHPEASMSRISRVMDVSWKFVKESLIELEDELSVFNKEPIESGVKVREFSLDELESIDLLF